MREKPLQMDPPPARRTTEKETWVPRLRGGRQALIAASLFLLTSCGSQSLQVDGAIRTGNPDARVQITAYSDFQCPACKEYHERIYPNIKKDFIDTEKITYIFRDFPIHGLSKNAHNAAHCADEQGKFEEMSDLLFRGQEINSMNQYRENAKTLGMNTGRFNQCLDEGRYNDVIDNNKQIGMDAGVTFTPSVFLDGKRLPVQMGYEEVKVRIEKELEKKK